MAVNAEVVTVSSTPTLVSGTPGGRLGQSMVVKVPSGGATVYFGGGSVDTTDGFPVASGENISLDANEEDAVYAVVAAATQDVNVLRQGIA